MINSVVWTQRCASSQTGLHFIIRRRDLLPLSVYILDDGILELVNILVCLSGCRTLVGGMSDEVNRRISKARMACQSAPLAATERLDLIHKWMGLSRLLSFMFTNTDLMRGVFADYPFLSVTTCIELLIYESITV
ncbi:hypothetical protein AHF37_10388 [Paragonimus kellicotti]|nr:hypothetical protein AHF37_10388 [Paragonimus kellicotti]